MSMFGKKIRLRKIDDTKFKMSIPSDYINKNQRIKFEIGRFINPKLDNNVRYTYSIPFDYIRRHPELLAFVDPKEIPMNKVKEIIRERPDALRYVRFQTQDLCIEAIKKNPYAIQFVNIPRDKMMVMEAFAKRPGSDYNMTEDFRKFLASLNVTHDAAVFLDENRNLTLSELSLKSGNMLYTSNVPTDHEQRRAPSMRNNRN